jgi:hypothetical protein
MKKFDMEGIDRLWSEAVTYITKDGWPTHVVDEEIATRLYQCWIQDTEEHWRLSGYRDRDLLRQALEETFIQHYGEEAGTARVIVFALLLECRARHEGQVRTGRPEA